MAIARKLARLMTFLAPILVAWAAAGALTLGGSSLTVALLAAFGVGVVAGALVWLYARSRLGPVFGSLSIEGQRQWAGFYIGHLGLALAILGYGAGVFLHPRFGTTLVLVGLVVGALAAAVHLAAMLTRGPNA